MSSSSFYSGSGLTNTEQDNIESSIAAAEAARDAAQEAQAAAETSETNAATSETEAATSASNASTSASNASTSASNASTSATNAATSASHAATSETNAATSASNAATSASNALTSETNAATSEANAATSEASASASATGASTSASNATTSATAAATSETNAATSETNAATSETNAATSASNAATSETNAASSATSAATSATNAATSETNASASATNAANYAASAYTSTANATIAKTAAETAKDAAEAALADFNGVYLGALASDPTVDANGDAVNEGDLYFNTVDNELLVYDGTNWVTSGITTVATSSADGLMSSTDKSKLDGIDQALATTDTPTFAGINNNGDIVFEGSTSDDYETTLTVEDPTADRTITLPDATGTVAIIDTNDNLSSFNRTTINGVSINPSLPIAGVTKLNLSQSGMEYTGKLYTGPAGQRNSYAQFKALSDVTLGGSDKYVSLDGDIWVDGRLRLEANTDIIFEGTTSDDYETTLTVEDPTADRTITLPNASGTVPLISVNGFTSRDVLTSFDETSINGVEINPSVGGAGTHEWTITEGQFKVRSAYSPGVAGLVDPTWGRIDLIGNVYLGGSGSFDNWSYLHFNGPIKTDLVFEGSTADSYETTVTITDPTADRTITIPDKSGEVIVGQITGHVDQSVDISLGHAYTFNFGRSNAATTNYISSSTADDGYLFLGTGGIGNDVLTVAGTYGTILKNGLSYSFFNSTGTNLTNLAAEDVTSDRTITLPDATGTVAVYSADGTSGQVLSTDGAGNLSFVDQGTLNELYSALSAGLSVTINCGSANFFSLSTSGNTTFTFSNPPASGTAYSFTLKITAGGNYQITYPTSVDWAGGTAPDAPASGETDLLAFTTYNGGTTWYGFKAGDAMA